MIKDLQQEDQILCSRSSYYRAMVGIEIALLFLDVLYFPSELFPGDHLTFLKMSDKNVFLEVPSIPVEIGLDLHETLQILL